MSLNFVAFHIHFFCRVEKKKADPKKARQSILLLAYMGEIAMRISFVECHFILIMYFIQNGFFSLYLSLSVLVQVKKSGGFFFSDWLFARAARFIRLE